MVFALGALALASAISPYGFAPLHLSSPAIEGIAGVVGMQTTVPENEYNRLAQALTDKERTLNERESALAAREAVLARQVAEDVRRENLRTLLLLAGAILILFFMVGVNFFFDMRRARKDNPAGHEYSVRHDGMAVKL